MRYLPCKDWDSGYCYNAGLRNGLNSYKCVGSDRCDSYKTTPKMSRIDVIGQNGNTGESYMSNNPAECGECGWTLHFDGDSYWCPNDDCLSVTGEKVIAHEPGLSFREEEVLLSQVAQEIPAEEYRPTIGAEKLAEDHWTYVELVLLESLDMDSPDKRIREIGFHYRSAFIHGFKHCAERD